MKITHNKLGKKKSALLVSIVISIIGFIPLLLITLNPEMNQSYNIEHLLFEDEDGIYISAFKYTPKGEKSHGGVVVGHSLLGNKIHMQALCIELARNGFTVINLDFRGHGASTGYYLPSELVNDMKAAVDYIESELPYITEIGLIGHSLGGNVAIDFIKAYPNRINATVTIGYVPYNAKSIPNLLITIGSFEPGFSEEILLRALRSNSGFENVSIGVTYGDFASGNATKVFRGSFSEHLFSVKDPAIISQIIQWFKESFNEKESNNIFVISPIYELFSYIFLFGLTSLNFVIIAYFGNYLFARKTIFSEKEIVNEVTDISLKKLIEYYTFPIAIIQFIIFIFIWDGLSDIIPLSTVNITFTLLASSVFGIIFIYYFFLFMKQKNGDNMNFLFRIKKHLLSNINRSILYGIFSALLLILTISTVWYWNVQFILPTNVNFVVIIILIPITFPLFLIREFYFKKVREKLKYTNKIKEYLIMVGTGIFMNNFFLVIMEFFSWMNFVYIPLGGDYLLVWLLMSIIQQIMVNWVYMYSGKNIIGSAIFLSIIYVWICIIFLPSYGFL
ncbi:MAG: alpha/beta hydrolase [Promethearchaeota archaeon]